MGVVGVHIVGVVGVVGVVGGCRCCRCCKVFVGVVIGRVGCVCSFCLLPRGVAGLCIIVYYWGLFLPGGGLGGR